MIERQSVTPLTGTYSYLHTFSDCMAKVAFANGRVVFTFLRAVAKLTSDGNSR